MDAVTVVALVVTVVAAAAERRGLTGHPLLAGDPVGSQTVVAEPARVTATVGAGPMQRLRVAEAKDFPTRPARALQHRFYRWTCRAMHPLP